MGSDRGEIVITEAMRAYLRCFDRFVQAKAAGDRAEMARARDGRKITLALMRVERDKP